MSHSATTLRNIGYYSFSGPVDRIVSNGAHPVCSPVTAGSPTEQRSMAGYLLADVVSPGCCLAFFSFVSALFRCRFLFRGSRIRAWSGVSRVSRAARLIEVDIFQIEVSVDCSDVQKLFSVIGNDGGDIMYKKVKISVKNHTEARKTAAIRCSVILLYYY